jgi:hypothetical protein
LRSTVDAIGSVAMISRVRSIARTRASTSSRSMSRFIRIAGGTAQSEERIRTLPRLLGVQGVANLAKQVKAGRDCAQIADFD